MAFLSRNLRLILLVSAVLLVVMGIIAVVTGKAKSLVFWDSPVRLEEVRSIGQLVTATYGGEVACDCLVAFQSTLDSLATLDAAGQNAWFDRHPEYKLLAGYRRDYLGMVQKDRQKREKSSSLAELRASERQQQAVVAAATRSLDSLQVIPYSGLLRPQSLREAISRQKTILTNAQNTLGNTTRTIATLDSEIAALNTQITTLRNSIGRRRVRDNENYFVVFAGTVRAGIDLTQARIDTPTQTVVLPPARVLDVALDIKPKALKNGKAYLIGSNGVGDAEYYAIRRGCARQLERDATASEKGKILDFATRNAVSTVTQFLAGVKKGDYKVRVEDTVAAK